MRGRGGQQIGKSKKRETAAQSILQNAEEAEDGLQLGHAGSNEDTRVTGNSAH